jgi:hypothetical protein
MTKPFWRALCVKCNHCVRTRHESSKFLRPFFLPDRCPSCHAWKDDSRVGENSGWKNSYGYYERETPFQLLKPKTWISSTVWKEIE